MAELPAAASAASFPDVVFDGSGRSHRHRRHPPCPRLQEAFQAVISQKIGIATHPVRRKKARASTEVHCNVPSTSPPTSPPCERDCFVLASSGRWRRLRKDAAQAAGKPDICPKKKAFAVPEKKILRRNPAGSDGRMGPARIRATGVRQPSMEPPADDYFGDDPKRRPNRVGSHVIPPLVPSWTATLRHHVCVIVDLNGTLKDAK